MLTNDKLAFDYILENCDASNRDCPALIILDHYMPVMDGLELMAALKKNETLERMEVVFYC